MKPIEFETTLTAERVLRIPAEVAAQLPDHGKATVVVVVNGDVEDDEWQRSARDHFLRDDTAADASYDRYL